METHHGIIALLSMLAPLSVQRKACFVKFMCEALEHDNSTLMYVTWLVCWNCMSVSGRNWCDCLTLSKYIGMIGSPCCSVSYYNYISIWHYYIVIHLNVKQVYSEWYDTVSDEEIGNECILREMIDVMEKWAKCDIFTIGHVDFIINDFLC